MKMSIRHLIQNIIKPSDKMTDSNAEMFEKTLENENSSLEALALKSSLSVSFSSFSEEIDYFNNNQRFYYITDLHLTHKIRDSKKKNRLNIIQDCVKNIVKDFPGILLIGGDIASDYSDYELFIRTLRKELDKITRRTTVIVILGNHELWDFPGLSFDEITRKYNALLEENGMYLLQNSVLYRDSEKNIHTISSEELRAMNNKQLYGILVPARYVILGGLGFSGYNDSFNANIGLYRDTIDRNEEIQQSKAFEELYNKLLKVIPEKKLVVLSHTPVDCWMQKVEYHDEYIYVYGHDHRNFFYDDSMTRIYADNQIGYNKKSVYLKWFDTATGYDWFSNYEDGIYEITRDDYIKFYRGNNMPLDFNRKIHKLYMLKKAGYYCFIHESEKNKSLSILNGGALKRLPQNNIEYFYNNMDAIISRIQSPLDKYTGFQERIAKEIKQIGGNGRIHGCIIDIDFLNHIYVNPIDLTVVSYWASDMMNKLVYPTIPALLEERCPSIYREYSKQINSNSEKLPILRENGNTSIEKRPQAYLDTDIYKASREIKKMQKLNSNILSVWVEPTDEKLLPDNKT